MDLNRFAAHLDYASPGHQWNRQRDPAQLEKVTPRKTGGWIVRYLGMVVCHRKLPGKF
jgi:hypothetical protein